MEHPCTQCGNPVEDGRPFCPQCRAPQVRVLIAPQPEEGAPDTPSEPSYPEIPSILSPVRSGGLDRRIAVRAALLAGTLGFVINTFIPLVGIMLTGALAVFFYGLFGGSSLSFRPASRLGAAAWTANFAVFSFLMVTAVTVFRAQFQEAMLKQMQAFGFDPAGPDVREMMRILLSPSGLALSLLLYFILGLVLAALGALLTASLGRTRA